MQQFEFDETGSILFAVVGPGLPAWPEGEAELRAIMASAGAPDWFLLDDALANIKRAQGADAQRRIKLAEKRDGQLKLDVSDDFMEATLRVQPPAGGKPVTLEAVRNSLRAAGILFGIDNDALAAAVARPDGAPVIVAKGRPPLPGQDAELIIKIGDRDRGPHVDAKGRADLRELNFIPLVRKGDLLMEKRPATLGLAGQNVIGETVPASNGADKPFNLGVAGVMVDPRNALRLLAGVAGRPVIDQDGNVSVDRAIELKEVNSGTGNIRFDGTVTIKGDIKAGFKVVASGSVIVGGRIEGADVEAKGDLDVRGGIIGTQGNKIDVGGNLSAKFVENVAVKAAGSVRVKDSIVHASVVAGDTIEVGEGGRGQIVDSQIRADKAVHAKVLGASGDSTTVVEVGARALAPEDVASLEHDCLEAAKLVDKFIGLAREAKQHDQHDALDQKIAAARANVLSKLRDKMKTMIDKQAGGDPSEYQVCITGKVHEGVTIRICGTNLQISRDTGPGQFVYRDGEVVYDPGNPASMATQPDDKTSE